MNINNNKIIKTYVFASTSNKHNSAIFHDIFWSGIALILGYSLGIEQSRISYFQDLSALI